MSRDPRYDILFEPVRIGPVTAKNRFYQVPHCTGLGWLRPRMLAALRGMKAEGGWGVVCTEYCSIHPRSDDLPYPYASLWDETDIKAHALMTEKVHAHGALAGAELWFGGARSSNLFSREVPLSLNSMPSHTGNPYQTKAMDKADIRAFRKWHRDAALRAKSAGFDIVYVYATHGYLLSHFLSRTNNTRSDEYGGSLENRVRLVREVIEETKDAVGESCAVAVRFSAEEGGGADGTPVIGERREMFELLAELPDLWDINIADYSFEMGVSRFVKEGGLEPYMDFVKSATSKPVVTVGRFTSPGRHGLSGKKGRRRLHRRGAALDRRSLPAHEDRARAGWTTYANASAATSAMPATARAFPSAAPRTRPWARNGGAAGTPKRSLSKGRTPMSWLSAPGRPGSRRPAPWASEGIG